MSNYSALALEEQAMIQGAANALWRKNPPAAALRQIAARFQLGRIDLSYLANDMFENILTPEVQAIWHWDISQAGTGIPDTELNRLLSHLTPWSQQNEA